MHSGFLTIAVMSVSLYLLFFEETTRTSKDSSVQVCWQITSIWHKRTNLSHSALASPFIYHHIKLTFVPSGPSSRVFQANTIRLKYLSPLQFLHLHLKSCRVTKVVQIYAPHTITKVGWTEHCCCLCLHIKRQVDMVTAHSALSSSRAHPLRWD